MAQHLNIPVVGLPSLEIISCLNTTEKNTLCLLDARKNKAYTGIYSTKNDIIQEPYLLDYDKALDLAQNNDFFVIADNVMSQKLNLADINNLNLSQKDYNFGIYTAQLTYKYLIQKENYLLLV